MSNTPRNQASKKIHNIKTKKAILAEGDYTVVPNKLRRAWRKGIISSGCFDLVWELLEHAESFHLREAYLLTIFSCRGSLKKAKDEAIARKMIHIEKVREGRSTKNIWHLLDHNGWILDEISPVENSPDENSPDENSPGENSMGLTIRTPNKKNLKNINGGGTREQNEEPPPFEGSFNSLSDQRAGDLFDTFRDHRKLGNKTRNYAPDIEGWKRVFKQTWHGALSEQIEDDRDLLLRMSNRLPKNADQLRSLVLEARQILEESPKQSKTSEEVEAEQIAHQQMIAERGSLDDIPF
jgi:hypothetical protein